ncbi:unnamed protein product [Schistosoma intercalatum]|nr:unnamed protein product [Schistosoma intercalatum]
MFALHRVILILVFLCISLDPLDFSKITEQIYNYVPLSYASFCTRKLNLTGQVGCSSDINGNSGVALFMNESQDIIQTLSSDTSTSFVVVVNVGQFVNTSLMRYFRSTTNIKGLIVFSNEEENYDSYAFSESSKCPNSDYSAYNFTDQCDLDAQWNPAGTEYSYISWPFPVVLVADVNNTIWTSMHECFSMLNREPADDTRCLIEINNPMSAVGSSETCFRRQYLMSLHISESSEIFCDELTGLNIILSVTDSKNHSRSNNISNYARSENSSVFVLTRMDSRSIFERSGFSSQGVLPSIAVLISVAVHLMGQKTLKDSQFEKDLLFSFLDNEAYDFMGSSRFSYDLSSGNIARYTGDPVIWNNVYAIIELDELGLSRKRDNYSMFFMLTDDKTYNVTRNLTDNIFHHLTAASETNQKVDIKRPLNKLQELPLPPISSMQTLLQNSPRPLPHVVLSDYDRPPFLNKHFESFLDTRWPPLDNPTADTVLLDFANTLADALHRIVSANHEPISSSIAYPKPSDIMECFTTNLGCDLFKMYLSPVDYKYVQMLKTPVPAQTYLPLGLHEIKISHLVSILLIGLTGERTSTPACPPFDKRGPYTYWMGYFNGSEQCYFTRMDITSQFLMMENEKLKAPAWMRSREHSERFLRWYRGASPTVDGFSVALGIFLMTLTLLIALYIKEVINKKIIQIPAQMEILYTSDNENRFAPT